TDIHSFPTRRSSDLLQKHEQVLAGHDVETRLHPQRGLPDHVGEVLRVLAAQVLGEVLQIQNGELAPEVQHAAIARRLGWRGGFRSEEHTSELQSLAY